MEMFIKASEGEIPFYRLRLDVKPGLTGWAQVAFRHTSDLSAYQEKFEYDLYYLSHRSLPLDLEIIARTVFTMLFKRSR
jgi:lipopolysaccharide/colanic/teichoic acid biosynthesis glycosyltransferase